MKKINYVERIIFILLFLFNTLIFSQTIIIKNKSDNILNIKYSNIKLNLKEGEIKTILNIKNISLENKAGLDQNIKFFLNTNEKLTVTLTNEKKITYNGDRDSLQSYIDNLNQITFGELKNYYKYYYQEKNSKKYINSSEILFVNISERIDKLNKPSHSEEIVKSLNNYIKYNWLYTVFLGFTSKNIDAFQKDIAPYYYKKYIKDDIPNFHCESSYQYDVLKYLAKYKKELGIQLPIYEVVATDDNSSINQYLPKSCQKYYFETNYKYLHHTNSTDQEYYKKILINQFHIDTLE